MRLIELAGLDEDHAHEGIRRMEESSMPEGFNARAYLRQLQAPTTRDQLDEDHTECGRKRPGAGRTSVRQTPAAEVSGRLKVARRSFHPYLGAQHGVRPDVRCGLHPGCHRTRSAHSGPRGQPRKSNFRSVGAVPQLFNAVVALVDAEQRRTGAGVAAVRTELPAAAVAVVLA
jgi:hypothetical protein